MMLRILLKLAPSTETGMSATKYIGNKNRYFFLFQTKNVSLTMVEKVCEYKPKNILSVPPTKEGLE